MAREQIARFDNIGVATKSHVMPRLEINIPMPAGVAIPARAPQTQSVQVPPSKPVQPAAVQSN
jgi:hypothetical protein